VVHRPGIRRVTQRLGASQHHWKEADPRQHADNGDRRAERAASPLCNPHPVEDEQAPPDRERRRGEQQIDDRDSIDGKRKETSGRRVYGEGCRGEQKEGGASQGDTGADPRFIGPQ
jgi:hypothetical protein